MKELDEIRKMLGTLSEKGNELKTLQDSIPTIFSAALKGAKDEHKEALSAFVKESNELINNSSKMSFLDIQNKTAELRAKYGTGTNNQ